LPKDPRLWKLLSQIQKSQIPKATTNKKANSKMKLFTFVSSLATLFLLCNSVATSAASPIKDSKESDADIVSSITKIALPNAFQRHLQISHHKDLILKKRQLQEPSACDEAYTDLYLDTTLAEAAEAYLDNYLTALETVNIDTSCIMNEVTLAIDCDFRQSTILGQQEFELACTDLGGQVVAFNMDTTCDMSIEGFSSSLVMKFTEPIDCIPTGCEDEAQTVIEEVVMEFQNQLESTLLANGITSVECA
jgi:hypothetical protein